MSGNTLKLSVKLLADPSAFAAAMAQAQASVAQVGQAGQATGTDLTAVGQSARAVAPVVISAAAPAADALAAVGQAGQSAAQQMAETGTAAQTMGAAALAASRPVIVAMGQLGAITLDAAQAARQAGTSTTGMAQAAAASTQALERLQQAQAQTEARAAALARSWLDLRGKVSQLQASNRDLSTSLSKTQKDLERLEAANRKLTASNGGLAQSYGSLKGAIAAVGAVALAREVVQAGVSFDSLQRTMRAVFGSSQAAAKEWEFARGEAYRLGLNLENTAKSYTRFAAAARNSSLAGQQTREIYTAVSEAGAVMSLSADEMQGALTAMEQMISKGVVSSEELKQQLGERLPGAFDLTAISMGYTNQQFTKLLESGTLTADKVLPNLAKGLRLLYADEAKDAAGRAAGQIENLKNAIYEAEVTIANSGFLNGVTAGIQALNAELSKPSTTAALQAIGSGLGNVIRYAAEHADQLKMLVEAYAAFKVATLVVDSARVAMQLYTGATIAATAAQRLFNTSVVANPYVRAAIALASITTLSGDYADALGEVTTAGETATRSSAQQAVASKSEADARRDAAKATVEEAKAKQLLADMRRAADLGVTLSAIKDERDALMDLGTAQRDAIERYGNYANAVRALRAALEAGRLTQDQYAAAVAQVAEKYKLTKVPEYTRQLAQEIAMLRLSGREREVATALLEAEDKARADNIALTKEQRQAIVALATVKQQQVEVDTARKAQEEDYTAFMRGSAEELKQLTLSQTEWDLYQAAQRAARLRQEAQGNAEALARIDEWYAAKKAKIQQETQTADTAAADATNQRLVEVREAHQRAVSALAQSQQQQQTIAADLTRLQREAADDAIDTERTISEARRRSTEQSAATARQQLEILSRVGQARQEAANQEREINQRIADDRRRAAEDARKFAQQQIQITKDLATAEAEYAAKIRDLYKTRNADQETADQKIREIRRRSMDEAGQQADIEAEAAERMQKAREALARGDLQTARSEGERAQGLAEQLQSQAAAIALIQQSAQALSQIKQAEIKGGEEDAQAKLTEARIAAAEKEKQLQADMATARDEAARREADNMTALAKTRSDLAAAEQGAVAQLLLAQAQVNQQAQRESDVRAEIKTRTEAATRALAAGDTEEAKRQADKIKSLGDQLTKENEVRDAIQAATGIITAARQQQVDKTNAAATAQAAYTDQVRAEVTETGNVVTKLTEAAAAHDSAASASEKSAARQKTSLGQVEQAAKDAVAKEKEMADGYGTGAEAARKSADTQVAALNRVIESLDRVKSKADTAASAMAGVTSAKSAGSGGGIGSLLSAFGFANGGIMTSAGPLPLKMYANGGIARSPQVAVYGEGRYPEAYVPLPDGRSIPVTLKGATGGGDTINLSATIQVDGDVDPDSLLDGLIDAARRRSARGLASLSVAGGR